ncbi:lipopeptide [Halomonas alkaliantarctica]|nr:lipopeptide [Halomonas alkaliantarctica]
MSVKHLIVGVAVLMALAGCGQKGPLYLPDDEAATNRAEQEG